MRSPPQCASPDWLGTAKEIGPDGWNDFEHLFFHPDGTLYSVLNDKFYKGPPPQGSSATDWFNQATLIVNVGWKDFQFLFFDPEGILYGVYNGKLYIRGSRLVSQQQTLTDLEQQHLWDPTGGRSSNVSSSIRWESYTGH